MITIPVQLSDELARRVLAFQDRLPEIIELGLRELAVAEGAETAYPLGKQRVLDALAATGLVTLPTPAVHRERRTRRPPVRAGGPLASALIIAERREGL